MILRTLAAILPLLLILVQGCCGNNAVTRAIDIMSPIESGVVPVGGGAASSVAAYRLTLDESPRIAELLRLGVGAADHASERLKVASTLAGAQIPDDALAVYAYIIEKMRCEPARTNLESYLLSNPGKRHHLWAPSFAVRALLVLKGKPDATAGYEVYSDADVVRALTNP
jgi:hypothetical protein